MIDKEKILQRLKKAHEQENAYNKEISTCNYQIKQATARKKKLAKFVSANMKYRNSLIKQLPSPLPTTK
jgi:hypothetical protein